MSERIRTAVSAVLLTVLIWFVADQFNQESLRCALSVRIAPQANSDRVVLVGPKSVDVIVEITGPTRLIQAFEKEVEAGAVSVTYWLDDTVATGRQSLQLRTALAGASRLDGFAIGSVTPASVAVLVDRLVAQPVPVTLESGQFGLTDQKIEPAQVEVRLPATVLASVGSDGMTVIADVRSLLIGQSEDALLNLPRVPIRLAPVVAGASLSLTEVAVEGRISLRSRKLRGVVVHFTGSQQFWWTYAVPPGDYFVDVEVLGPEHVIDGLEPLAIRASVDVSEKDYRPDGSMVSKRVVFELPPGVTLKRDQDVSDLSFKLVERAAVPTGS